MNKGWIKLHRQILKWEWFKDNNTFKLFLYLVLKANHQKKECFQVQLLPGQLITGRKKIAKETGLSEQTIRTSMAKLVSTNEVTIKSTNRYSLITVNNYSNYQSTNQHINQDINQQVTTNKNDKEIKRSVDFSNYKLIGNTMVEVEQ